LSAFTDYVGESLRELSPIVDEIDDRKLIGMAFLVKRYPHIVKYVQRLVYR
jgi:hypothetical protein